MNIIKWSGEPISKPGIYSGVPISRYHGGKLCVGPAISSSGLRSIFSDSPAHYWAYSPLNQERVVQPDSEALIIGRAVHHVLLGEPDFKAQFVIRPDKAPDGRAWNGNNGTCKKWIADQEAAGLSVLTPDQVETIKGMALALSRDPRVRAGSLNGMVECTFAWEDKETGVWLLARPDNFPVDSSDFVDLKTTRSVRYEALVRTVGDYAYHQQGALVGEGFEIITGEKMSSFSNYFVEKTPPFCSDMRQYKIEELQRGALMNRSAIRTFAKCWNAKQWPGPAGDQGDIGYIELSERAQMWIDDRLKLEGLL